MILGRRIHLIAGERKRRPKAPQLEPAPDHLASGDAWARVYFMRDGSVVVDGKRGTVVLSGELAAEVQASMRIAGVKER